MNRNHLMIRASAGSGKTYQLAVRFLALLALDRKPERILALTFTRKAAGEFTDRIFSRLAKAAANDAEATNLGREMREAVLGAGDKQGLAPGWSEPLPATREEFAALLRVLVETLDRLAMGTYDSFFVRIGRVHACELGLGSFHLMEEIEAAEEQDRIFRRIFGRLESSQQEREAFLNAFKDATIGRSEIRLSDALAGFIGSHHHRFLACPAQAAWGTPERLWHDADPWPKVGDWQKMAEDLEGAFAGISWGHSSAGPAWEKALEWIASYSPAKPKTPALITNLMRQVAYLLAGHGNFKNYKDKPVEGKEAVLLGTLAGGIIGAEIRHQQKLTQGLWRLMDLYERQYAAAVRRRGRVGFADLTHILSEAGLAREGVGQAIGFRLDQRFDHWMLDEFQDTNRKQWDVVRGLLQEVQQDEGRQRTFFVVGDAKQAVHQWRGADPRLFDEIARDPGWLVRMVEWSMDTSRRSSPAVLDMVNLVCDPAQPWMAARFPPAALDRWPFHAHQAAPDKALLAGCAQVVECPEPKATEGDDDGEESPRGTLPVLLAMVREIDPLARGLSCGVLVSTNNEADEVAEFLRTDGVAVEVEGEAEAGMDSPVATALLDLFRWLHAPEDRLAFGHVKATPLLGILGGLFPANGEDGGGEAWWWAALRRELAMNGFGHLAARFSQALEAGGWLDDFNRMRLRAWVREAARFDDHGGSPGDFVRWMSHWTQREHTRPGAVQVMTVHKSKGLEFDVVFLPGLRGQPFDHANRLRVMEETDERGGICSVLLAPAKPIIAADKALTRQFDAWVAAQCYERFCLLYVAMTRARRGLYLLLPTARNAGGTASPLNFEDWIREAATTAGTKRSADWGGVAADVLHGTGDAAWYRQIAGPAPVAAPAPVAPLPALPARRQRTTPSGLKTTDAIRCGNAASDRRRAMEFGSAVHAAFEAIGWLEDGELPSLPDDPEVRRLVESCLEAPAFRALFRHPGGEIDLLREQPFERIEGEFWISGIMDRAHVANRDGRPVSATIIDFKTDAVEAATALAERYQPQMEAYRAALAAILGLEPAAIRCLLASTCLCEVVEV